VVKIPFLLVCAVGTTAFLTPNPLLTAVGVAVLPWLVHNLSRKGEPPVLLLAALYQWAQAFASVVGANVEGRAIGHDDLLPDAYMAIMLSYAAVAVLALGMRLGRGRTPQQYFRDAYGMIPAINPRRALALYIVVFCIAMFVQAPIGSAGGLKQLFIPLLNIRSAVLLMVFVMGVHDRRFTTMALVVGVFEFFVGFLGFFANYKEVAIYALLAYCTKPRELVNFMRWRMLAFICIVGFSTLTWQAIKGEYRQFLNQGTFTQQVLVSFPAKVEYLVSAVGDLRMSDMVSASGSLVSRLGYTDFFARSIRSVPDRIGFQKGALWAEAIERTLTPRIFFPDKSIVDDSTRTREFTGLNVAGADEGASIGLGYVAETYIDFGPLFMFAIILGLGIFWGATYRFLMYRSKFRLLSFSLAAVYILPGAMLMERSNIKIVGGSVGYLLVITPILHLIGIRVLRFLSRGGRRLAWQSDVDPDFSGGM
jgi:hypothetical protein